MRTLPMGTELAYRMKLDARNARRRQLKQEREHEAFIERIREAGKRTDAWLKERSNDYR